MNNKVAIALIVAFIFSLLFGLVTAKESIFKYYNNKYKKEQFIIEKEPGETYVTEYDLRVELVLISFLGGFGLGYLLADKIEDEARKIYKNYKDRKKPIV